MNPTYKASWVSSAWYNEKQMSKVKPSVMTWQWPIVSVTMTFLRNDYSVRWLMIVFIQTRVRVSSGTFSLFYTDENSFKILWCHSWRPFFFLLFFIFLSFPNFSLPFATTSALHVSPLLSFYLTITFPLLPLRTFSASKDTRGSGWMTTSFSFPLMLSSHSAVACSVRAERTPGSPPEASARRSPPLPAHLREPSEWSTIVLAVIWWPHSTGRQSQEPGGSPTAPTPTGYVEALLVFFFLFLILFC